MKHTGKEHYMAKNIANEETTAFIKKMQNALSDLVEESTTIDDPGMKYYCPLNRFLEMAEAFYCKEPEELIDEQSDLFG